MELHVKEEQKDEKGQRKLTKKCWKTAGAKESSSNFASNIKWI